MATEDWVWIDHYDCICGEDLSTLELPGLMTTYAAENSKMHLYWWHLGCYADALMTPTTMPAVMLHEPPIKPKRRFINRKWRKTHD